MDKERWSAEINKARAWRIDGNDQEGQTEAELVVRYNDTLLKTGELFKRLFNRGRLGPVVEYNDDEQQPKPAVEESTLDLSPLTLENGEVWERQVVLVNHVVGSLQIKHYIRPFGAQEFGQVRDANKVLYDRSPANLQRAIDYGAVAAEFLQCLEDISRDVRLNDPLQAA